jgi:hypothetical protein
MGRKKNNKPLKPNTQHTPTPTPPRGKRMVGKILVGYATNFVYYTYHMQIKKKMNPLFSDQYALKNLETST